MNVYEQAADTLLRETGCTVIKWRDSMSGLAWTGRPGWDIECPRPRGAISFAILAHEVGHQMLHRSGSKQRWLEEFEAWEYALAQFDRFQLPRRYEAEKRAMRKMGRAGYRAVRRSNRKADKLIEIWGRIPMWVWTNHNWKECDWIAAFLASASQEVAA